uniref:Uncharacterized LOC104265792 n=1 Tax=Ciona intestinalis TaxID=7719 RepID=H2Y041_CIOIN
MAKNEGVKILAIGVGNANQRELVVLTRPEIGTSDRVYSINEYDALQNLVQTMRSNILA